MRCNAVLILLASLLALPAAVQAEDGGADAAEDAPATQEAERKVYRSVNPDGSVSFSDQGDDSQETVEIRKPSTVQMVVPEIKPAPEVPRNEPQQAPYEVRVTRPTSEQTFQNPGEPLAVGYTVKPALRQGHTAEVVYDGQVLDGKTIEWPSRGEHTVVVRVVDEGGAELAVSEPVVFFVHRVSKRLP